VVERHDEAAAAPSISSDIEAGNRAGSERRSSPRSSSAGSVIDLARRAILLSAATSFLEREADRRRERTRTPSTRAATLAGAGGYLENAEGPAVPRQLEARKFRFSDFVSADFFAEAEHRYLEAVARRDAISVAWEAENRPLLAVGSTGQLVEHPLVKMLREHDVLVDRLAASARRRHRGPEPSAVLKPTIGRSPAAKLRSV
jgi:hypothetical protein